MGAALSDTMTVHSSDANVLPRRRRGERRSRGACPQRTGGMPSWTRSFDRRSGRQRRRLLPVSHPGWVQSDTMTVQRGEAPGARSTRVAADARRREPPPTEQPSWLPPPQDGLTMRAECHHKQDRRRPTPPRAPRRSAADAKTRKPKEEPTSHLKPAARASTGNCYGQFAIDRHSNCKGREV